MFADKQEDCTSGPQNPCKCQDSLPVTPASEGGDGTAGAAGYGDQPYRGAVGLAERLHLNEYDVRVIEDNS